MSEIKMGKQYSPKDFEEKIYDKWLGGNYFEAKVNPEKEPFSIVLPPPNITGQLHMGHALDHTIQDVIIRFKRMQGFETLWLPGTDHASIATEVKVLDKIRETEGKTKDQLSREEFLEKAWAWKEEYGDRIVHQMYKLGNSCDWSKERFTMDQGCSDAVTEVFINLYEKGHIYRGNRLINWCPDCGTSLSDAEVEHAEKAGKFYHVKYQIENSDEYLEIATTRPETMLGDTALAVHPEDERYQHLIGKHAILPLVGRKLPIIADDYVDRELGTGALKITPAHDPNDFAIGERHKLPSINVMNDDATMNKEAGKYEGMDRFACRKALVKDLEEEGHLVKVKDHEHNVGQCYRCDTIVEPRLSDQWFVSMEALAKPAIDAVKNGDMTFIPERFTKTYMHWLENIRDWCISRQLWWGHRIPAYYCDACGEIIVQKEEPSACTCGSTKLRQDEDVLDTWFSSALWPFSTLGWPEETPELSYFYPTNVLVTGYDIIFFWVVRMMFSGLEQMGQVPFDHTLIHGLVRDPEGRKMSKSLGNGVDPLEVIDTYGADALRFMLATGNSPGNDMRYQTEKVEASRNFANKLWNASRFVLTTLEDKSYDLDGTEQLEIADQWILEKMDVAIEEITENLDKYELGLAADKIYQFTWDEYCDWYIELTKKRLYGEDVREKETAQKVLLHVLKAILKLLHPFMPFITEEIWSNIPKVDQALIIAPWPVSYKGGFGQARSDMELMMQTIKSIRNLRAEMDVPPSRKARLLIEAEERVREILLSNVDYLKALASVSDAAPYEGTTSEAVTAVIEGGKVYLPLDDLVDYQKEFDRLSKEEKKLTGEVTRASKKLANEGFVSKAPEALIASEREKLEKYEQMLGEVKERLQVIKEKLS